MDQHLEFNAVRRQIERNGVGGFGADDRLCGFPPPDQKPAEDSNIVARRRPFDRQQPGQRVARVAGAVFRFGVQRTDDRNSPAGGAKPGGCEFEQVADLGKAFGPRRPRQFRRHPQVGITRRRGRRGNGGRCGRQRRQIGEGKRRELGLADFDEGSRGWIFAEIHGGCRQRQQHRFLKVDAGLVLDADLMGMCGLQDHADRIVARRPVGAGVGLRAEIKRGLPHRIVGAVIRPVDVDPAKRGHAISHRYAPALWIGSSCGTLVPR
ncbi:MULTISPECIES: hypothetical protein [unclassified Bradyrhizobium]|uniref:hypothetical protein n=1 Tax=unclassified Bradyrhizobium TaxID=2631580 RepID=UPI002916B920|nr:MULTISPECIES: hypothetical protein [unclassified Bradyrhizobium]